MEASEGSKMVEEKEKVQENFYGLFKKVCVCACVCVYERVCVYVCVCVFTPSTSCLETCFVMLPTDFCCNLSN